MTRTIPLTKLIPNTDSWIFAKCHRPKVNTPFRPCALVEIEKHMRGVIFYVPLRVEIANEQFQTLTDETRKAEYVVFEFRSSAQKFLSFQMWQVSIAEAREQYRNFLSFGYRNPFTMELA